MRGVLVLHWSVLLVSSKSNKGEYMNYSTYYKDLQSQENLCPNITGVTSASSY